MPDIRLLTKSSPAGIVGKEIVMFQKPESLRPVLSRTGWIIFKAFAERAKYPAEVARELGLYRQKVYYYSRKLIKTGLIVETKQERLEGGIARYYEAVARAVGLELPFGERPVSMPSAMDRKLQQFLSPIIEEGMFNGRIVVGSPEPHGPNKTVARDGHYAIQLALFLGQFCQIPKEFVVKLDVDLKRDGDESNNLILIGGPGTNLITAEVNRHLPTRFDEQNYWAGLRDFEGRIFSGESEAVIAKIRSPFDEKRTVVILAGNRHIGTKSAVIALTRFPSLVLKDFTGGNEWALVIRGFDLDADGKIDSVESVS